MKIRARNSLKGKIKSIEVSVVNLQANIYLLNVVVKIVSLNLRAENF